MGNTSSPRRREEQEIHPQESEINDHMMIDEDNNSSSDNGHITCIYFSRLWYNENCCTPELRTYSIISTI